MISKCKKGGAKFGEESELTGQEEENKKVHDQNRPKDGQIEDGEETTGQAQNDGLCGRVPELELGKTADERAELLVLFRGEAAG